MHSTKPRAALACLLAVLLPFAQSCSVTLPVAGHFADKATAKRKAPKSHKWLYTGLVTGMAIDATLVILILNALGNSLDKAYSSPHTNCNEKPAPPDC
ncbi:MAG: hypothetical protein AAB214_03665 [Fibrobacterota bacterium]